MCCNISYAVTTIYDVFICAFRLEHSSRLVLVN